MAWPFWKLLTEEQLTHLRDNKVRNVSDFVENRRLQKELDADSVRATCPECNFIEERVVTNGRFDLIEPIHGPGIDRHSWARDNMAWRR